MTVKLTTIIVAIISTFHLTGQNWETQSLFGPVDEVKVFENKAYVANRGGLLVINLDDGTETLLNASNTSIPELGIDEIEILDSGELWVTTRNKKQLYYFDGLDFQLHCDSISNIRTIKAKDDVLWILTGRSFDNQHLYSFSNNIVTDYSSNLTELVGDFAIDNSGIAWLAMTNKLGKIENGIYTDQLTLPEPINTYPTITYQKYFIDSRDRHWISRGVDGPAEVVYFENGKWEVVVTHELITQFYEFDGSIYYNSAENYGKIIDGEFIRDYFFGFTARPNYDRILRLESLNAIWLYNTSGRDYRVFRLEKEGFTEYGEIDSFPSNQIYDIAQDCDGHLLCTEPNLLSIHDGNTWDFISKSTHDPSRCYLYEIIPNPNCKTFISSLSTLCRSLWEVNQPDMQETDILPISHRDHQFGTDGCLYLQTWIGSNSAIAKIDSLGRIENFLHPVTLNRNALILITSDNHVILSGYDSALNQSRLFILEELEWREVDINLGEEISLDEVIFEDSQNHIWFANNKQLIEYDWENITYHALDLPNETSRITKIIEDEDQNLWLSTHNAGIIHWKRDAIDIYDSSNSEILSDICEDLELIDNEHLWINHFYGLSKLNIKKIEETQNQDTTSTQFSLYPNPTQSSFTLSFPHKEQRQIEIFSADGRLVYSTETDEENLILSDLKTNLLVAGCYWVRVSGASGEAVEKVILY